MKVRVRKIKLTSKSDDTGTWASDSSTSFRDNPEYVKDQREYMAEMALFEKARQEYFELFPDDDEICILTTGCGLCAIDICYPQCRVQYIWGVENHKHWWEYPNLPDFMLRAKKRDNFPSFQTGGERHGFEY